MSLRQWIEQNRAAVDNAIENFCRNCLKNDEERILWILNEDDLIEWAKSEGVQV